MGQVDPGSRAWFYPKLAHLVQFAALVWDISSVCRVPRGMQCTGRGIRGGAELWVSQKAKLVLLKPGTCSGTCSCSLGALGMVLSQARSFPAQLGPGWHCDRLVNGNEIPCLGFCQVHLYFSLSCCEWKWTCSSVIDWNRITVVAYEAWNLLSEIWCPGT